MRQFFHLLFLIPALSPARATEYDLSAYLAEPETIAAAIGSNDSALKARMESLTDYVAENGLEERFDPPGQWRSAVADLVAGRPRANEFINGFALEMLFLSVADRASPSNMGAPFADLETASNYLRHRQFHGAAQQWQYGWGTRPLAARAEGQTGRNRLSGARLRDHRRRCRGAAGPAAAD